MRAFVSMGGRRRRGGLPLDLRLSVLAFVGLLATALGPVRAANPPGQPLAGVWHLKTNAANYLLNYNLAADPDAPFNRATVPLATRTLTTAPQVNSHARPNEAGIVSLAGFHAAANNPAQGSLDSEYYAFGYWQYIDRLVFWGGSAGEGIVLAPNPTIVDAAHRSGVPVLGNVFFPPTAFGGQIEWVSNFVQKVGANYPAADQLIQIATNGGFDGWFINQETAGGNAALATAMRNLISYIKSNSTLQVMWYDAMTESGTVNWQDQLNSANDMFFDFGGAAVSDTFFADFGWGSTQVLNSRSNAQALGRSPYEVYHGVDVGGTGFNTTVNWTAVFPEGSAHRTSMGFYQPNWTADGSTSVANFQSRDNQFWVGPNGDPSDTTTTNAWKGIAHYIPDRTAIRTLPFVTHFNAGQGTRWNSNGVAMHYGSSFPWNNLSVQDVLPTWRWIVETTSTNKLVPDLAFDRSYYGGSSLKVSGTLDATNLVKLYKTSFLISSNTNLRLAYRLGTNAVPTHMKIALAFEDAPTAHEYFDVGNSTSASWATNLFSLAAHSGRRLLIAGLAFASPSPVAAYSINIGQLAFFNGAVDIPAPPTGLTLEQFNRIDSTNAAVRIKWTHSASTVRQYNVYRRNANNSLTWLWSTPNNACFVPDLPREGAETNLTLVVEAVSLEFGASTPATLVIPWTVTVPNLVARFAFEDNVDDTSGSGNHGTVFGTASYSASFDGSRALVFNGSNTYVRLPRVIGDGSFTISLWMRTTNIDAGTTAWYSGNGLADADAPGSANGKTNDFGTAVVGERFAFGMSDGATENTISSSTDIVNGAWHHLAAVFNVQTSEMSLYVDGVREGYDIGPPGPKTAAPYLRLGGIATGGKFFNGRMDDVRLYDGALLTEEVASLAAGVDPFGPPEISAIADLTIAEDSATSALAFTVGDTQIAASLLTLTGASSNTNLVAAGGIVFGGSSSNRTVTVTPRTNQFGTTTITVTVSDGGTNASETFLLTVTNVNDAPVLAPVADRAVSAGDTLTVAPGATDVDVPAQTLTFSLLAAPPGATLAVSNGLFSWRPGLAAMGTTNLVKISVVDSGAPVLGATQSFNVIVGPPAAPVVSAPGMTNGRFLLLVTGATGADFRYTVEVSEDLATWQALYSTNPAFMPFSWFDRAATSAAMRFYRVTLGP